MEKSSYPSALFYKYEEFILWYYLLALLQIIFILFYFICEISKLICLSS